MNQEMQKACLGALVILLLAVAVPIYAARRLNTKIGTFKNITVRFANLQNEETQTETTLNQFQNVSAKIKAVQAIQAKMNNANPQDIQNLLIRGGALNPRLVVQQNKITASFNARYVTVGKIISDMWNSYPLLKLNDLTIQGTGGEDGTLLASITITIPPASTYMAEPKK